MGSLLERYPRARTSGRTCTPRALSIRTTAPMPKRFETVPRSSTSAAVGRVVVIAQDRDASLVVGVDDVEVAVAAQVAEGGAEADALLVEAPCGADVLELEVAQVAEGEVGLGEDRAVVHDPDPLRRRCRTPTGGR